MTSANFLGADTGALRGLAGRLSGAAGQLRAVADDTRRRVHQTQWYGRDAEQFRADWDCRYATAMRAVGDALDAAGRQLLAEAQQQDVTSAGGSVEPAGSAPSRLAGGRPGNWPDAGAGAWDVWSRWSARLSAAVAATPVLASAIRWSDAPQIGAAWWKMAAETWSDVHLPTAGLGSRLVAGIDVASVFSDTYAATTAALQGDWVTTLEHGIPAALTTASASPNPWVSFPAIAGNAGWQLGGWVYDTYDVEIQDGIEAAVEGIDRFNASPIGIWIGDTVVGPTGDALVGAWDRLASSLSSAEQQDVNP